MFRLRAELAATEVLIPAAANGAGESVHGLGSSSLKYRILVRHGEMCKRVQI